MYLKNFADKICDDPSYVYRFKGEEYFAPVSNWLITYENEKLNAYISHPADIGEYTVLVSGDDLSDLECASRADLAYKLFEKILAACDHHHIPFNKFNRAICA